MRRRAVEGFIGIGRQLITDAALQASKASGRSQVTHRAGSDWVEKTLVPNINKMLNSTWSKEVMSITVTVSCLCCDFVLCLRVLCV